MGNVLEALSAWLPFVVTFYCLWCLNVLRVIFKFFVEQPWGMVSERRRMIARAQKRREEGFDEWRKRIDGADEQTIKEFENIVSMSLLELRDALQKDELTAVRALEAYVWKALKVQELFNPICEIIKEAFLIAADVDQKYGGKDYKPALFGIPFSVKSNFHMAGYDCHVGLGKMLENPKEKDCSMVTHLRSLGAVPFCLTNVPEALISFLCSNPVYGTTGNPHDNTRSPGGSSGGEASLLVAGGSPFGIGSDLAGSLRIPAALSGCVSLKVTQERLVVIGSHGGVPGRGRLALGFGYFTKSVDEQILLLNEIVGNVDYCDLVPTSVRLPLNVESIRNTDKLRIGYFEDDGFLRPAPAMTRAVQETVEKLRSEGHELVKFTVPDIQNAADLVFRNILPDGGEYIRNLFKGDVVDEYMKKFVFLLNLPPCIRSLLSWVLGPFSPQASLVCNAYVRDLSDLRYTQEQTDLYKEVFLDYWKLLGIDALICPSFPTPAMPHEWPSQLGTFAVSTCLWNMLDLPAGVVPIGKVTAKDDEMINDEEHFPTGYNLAYRLMRQAAGKCEGLPISVQIVTLPYQEEKCLRVMKDVERLFNE